MSNDFDVLIIGGGPGGYVAAIRAAQLGLRTALIEKRHLGGICLNWGCIPTKALLHGAEIAHQLKHLEPFGFSVDNPRFDLKTLVGHSRAVSGRLTQGIEYLMNKQGVEVIRGHGQLIDKGRVAVIQEDVETRFSADHIILATGARPRQLPGVQADGLRIWTYFQALVPEQVPRSMLIVGSGAIGLEFASFYNDLGCEVTLIELADRIMPQEDAEVAALVHKAFEQRGIRIHTQMALVAAESGPEQAVCQLRHTDGRILSLNAERVLLAAGVQPNIEDMGLEDLGVVLEKGFVHTDQWCRTNVFGLYAIGDVAGAPCLAHKASHEALICIDHLAGVEHVRPLRKDFLPACTYSRPQVASLGMTEAQARATGRALKVGRFSYQANGKALAIGDPEGFVKTLFDAQSGELLGAHMVGPDVTEQIQGFSIAHSLEATEEALLHSVFAHPTLSEAMHESILAACGRPLHQ